MDELQRENQRLSKQLEEATGKVRDLEVQNSILHQKLNKYKEKFKQKQKEWTAFESSKQIKTKFCIAGISNKKNESPATPNDNVSDTPTRKSDFKHE